VNELANAQAGLTGKPLEIAIDRIRQRDFDAPHAAAPIELSPKAARDGFDRPACASHARPYARQNPAIHDPVAQKSVRDSTTCITSVTHVDTPSRKSLRRISDFSGTLTHTPHRRIANHRAGQQSEMSGNRIGGQKTKTGCGSLGTAARTSGPPTGIMGYRGNGPCRWLVTKRLSGAVVPKKIRAPGGLEALR